MRTSATLTAADVILVDTSVLAAPRLGAELTEAVAISTISVGELRVGVLAADSASVRDARQQLLTTLLARATVLAVDLAVAERYGALRQASGRGPTNDLWIAATALAHKLVLVTADDKQSKLSHHFPDLATRYLGPV